MMNVTDHSLCGTDQACRTTLTTEQVSVLLRAIANKPEYRDLDDVVKLMLRSAIRPGELARLRWTDFLFGLRVMRVEDCKARVFQGTIMDREAVALLQARRDREESNFVLGKVPRRSLRRVTEQFRCLTVNLGLPAGGLMILRHTALAERMARRTASA